VRFLKFYAQKSSRSARKLLVAQADSAIITAWLARAPALRSGAGGPSGGGSPARDRQGRACSPPRRRALREMRSARHSAGRVEAGAPMPCFGCKATPADRKEGHAAPDRERSLGTRLRIGGRCAARGCAPSRARHRARTGRRRCPARTPSAVGKAHPLMSRGAGSGSLRGVSGIRKDALAPLALDRLQKRGISTQ
jgi:hypothetical protein